MADGALAAAAMPQVRTGGVRAEDRAGGVELINNATSAQPVTSRRRHCGGWASRDLCPRSAQPAGRVAVESAVIDRLQCAFGLVRYGVAPDMSPSLDPPILSSAPWKKPLVRFYGDVTLGSDLSIEEPENPSTR